MPWYPGYLVILLASVVFGCGGCSFSLDSQMDIHPPDMHNSRNALDWSGTYAGTLPCADCSGIRTTLTLTPAHTYVLKSIYLGVKAARTEYICEGVFTWDDAGSRVELLDMPGGRKRFQVGENRLFALDQSGKRIHGELAEMYVLERVNDVDAENVAAAVAVFADKPWELVELRDAPLEEGQSGAAWLVFERESQRVYGSAGCNRLTGGWKVGNEALQPQTHARRISAPLPLSLSPLGTTMMACPPGIMRLEGKFLSALAGVTGMYLDGDALTMVDKSARMVARFKERKTP